MLKKFIVPVILLAAAIVVFIMYRRQHQLYQETLQLNRRLTTEIGQLQKQNDNLRQSIRQMQQAEAASNLLHPTFIDQQKYYRQNWKNYIHLSLNDYSTGFLGGIKNIKVTISNQTDYALDEATAVVNYYRASGELFKSETIHVKNIPPQKSRQVNAPDSRRGMSVKARLTRITSRTMNFCWWEDKKTAPGDDDPFKCAGKDSK